MQYLKRRKKLSFGGQSALPDVKCNSRHIFNQVVVMPGTVSDESLSIHFVTRIVEKKIDKN